MFRWKSTLKVLSVIILALTFTQYGQSQEKTEKIKRDYWSLSVSLDVPELKPQALQYAVVDFDPIAQFKIKLRSRANFLWNMISKSATEEEKKKHIKFDINYYWGAIFEKIDGSHLYMMGNKTSFSSYEQKPRKWFITKTTQLNENPICWCILLNPVIGNDTSITLTKENLCDLTDAFNEVMREAAVKESVGTPTYPRDSTFKNENKSRNLYDCMIKALKSAKSLYFESAYYLGIGSSEPEFASEYRAWLKKPNYARIEAYTKGKKTGTLVGDGEFFWTYWGEDEEIISLDTSNSAGLFMKYRSPPRNHSLAHMIGELKSVITMPILELSIFHNCRDGLDDYMDGVRKLGAEVVDGEECDIIEVSYMQNQRSKYFWISHRDYLPRKMKEVVRVANTLVTEEVWSNVFINVDIPNTRFEWKPPDNWQVYKKPKLEDGLLSIGTRAPDFEFKDIKGKNTRLSEYQGKVLFINFWRAG